MTANIYIIRHGETDWNKAKRFQGQIDIPLNNIGLDQAERLKSYFMDRPIDHIFSSDLLRAFQTAQPLANHYQLEISIYQSLRERSYGKLEGRYAEEIKLNYSEETNDWLEIEEHGIEPLIVVKERIYKQVREIVQKYPNKNIVIVSHGASINAFLSMVSHGHYGSGKTKILNTGVTQLESDGDHWRVVTVNDVSHLHAGRGSEVI